MQEPTFLRVDATFRPDGMIVPTAFYWTDGTPYYITVVDVRPGHSEKHGHAGTRYKIRLRGAKFEHTRYLYLVGTKWFIEEKDPA